MLDAFADQPTATPTSDETGLVSYVMNLVSRWRKFRDGNYSEKWDKYDSIYRGEWNDRLRTKTAERSKVITPATTNAVDQSVAEIVEAIFGRGKWFDVDEDPDAPDQLQQAAEKLRDQLQDDLHRDGIKTAVIQTVFNGAKFGTGICKRIVDEKTIGGKKVPYVTWETVPPKNFVIDTSATSIEDAHGCAHETMKPTHWVKARQESGEFMEGDIGGASGFGSAQVLTGPNGQTYEKDPLDGVYITEYHGLVPRWMLDEATKPKKQADPLESIAAEDVKGSDGEMDDDDVVEAIVTVANGSTLLKAVENPIVDHDRGFIAYQHYVKPNSFWGIGVIEKAWNSQMALDAEIRARMDTLALITYPSITADATRLPRNLDLTVTPGKVFRTNGRGSEIIEPLKFGNLDPVTFQHSADLERYVQLATGASDPSTPVNTNRGPQATASGNSMQFGSYIKRAKLPMQNIDENFLDPLVRKSLLAYQTIDQGRYPAVFDYSVNSTLSIMAREFEQMQLTNLMALLPQGSPEYSIVLTAIIDNYSGPSKDKIIAAIKQTQQPDPQKQQMQQLQMQTAQATLQKLQAEIEHTQTQSQLTKAKIPEQIAKPRQKDTELHIQALEAHVSAEHTVHSHNAAHHGHEVARTGHLIGGLAKIHHVNTQAQTAADQLAAQPPAAPSGE